MDGPTRYNAFSTDTKRNSLYTTSNESQQLHSQNIPQTFHAITSMMDANATFEMGTVCWPYVFVICACLLQ